jgi:16S rRNA (cytidine1402-2'-O)-methyltransferase
MDEYEIQKPLKSFHQFNEKEIEDRIIIDLKNGQDIALISDAGTPGICDPGERIVRRCYTENIPFTSIPGPSAFAVALSLCPFSKERVQFLGFLAKKEQERKRTLAAALSSPTTVIFYESPHRLIDTLSVLPAEKNICIIREISKKFEEKLLGTAKELLEHFKRNEPKGEFVILIEGTSFDYSHLTPENHVKELIKDYNISKSDAIKIAAELRCVPKRNIYDACHDI